MCFFEACCRTVGAPILHRTDCKVLETKRYDKWPCYNCTKTPGVCFDLDSMHTKESRMRAIVAAGDYNLTSPNSAKSFRYRAIVTGHTCRGSLWGLNVIPPESIFSHPVYLCRRLKTEQLVSIYRNLLTGRNKPDDIERKQLRKIPVLQVIPRLSGPMCHRHSPKIAASVAKKIMPQFSASMFVSCPLGHFFSYFSYLWQ